MFFCFKASGFIRKRIMTDMTLDFIIYDGVTHITFLHDFSLYFSFVKHMPYIQQHKAKH